MASATDDQTSVKPRWTLAKREADARTRNYSFPPIPVLEIAERSGVNVVFTEFGEFNEKVAGFCDFANRRLYVNQSDSTNRQTFTMAHELGHWILHRSYYLENPDKYPVLPRFGTPNNDDPLEKEANTFAANLLVPEVLLRPVLKVPITELAEVFRVSREMMEWRVKNVRGQDEWL